MSVFNVKVNDAAVMARLQKMPATVIKSLEAAITILAENLRSHVVQDKLMGQVLNRVTGALGASIAFRVETTDNSVKGIVYSSGNVVYGRIHEYGETIQRRMTVAWGRPVKNPRMITAHYPERSFMRSSLADMKEDIIDRMTAAVRDGARE